MLIRVPVDTLPCLKTCQGFTKRVQGEQTHPLSPLDIRKLYVKLDEVDMNTGRIILPTSTELRQMKSETVVEAAAPSVQTEQAPPRERAAARPARPTKPARAAVPPRYIQAPPDIPALTMPEKEASPEEPKEEEPSVTIHQSGLPLESSMPAPRATSSSLLPALAALFAVLILFCAYLLMKNAAMSERLAAPPVLAAPSSADTALASAVNDLNAQIILLREEVKNANATLSTLTVSVAEPENEIEEATVEYYEEVEAPVAEEAVTE